MNYKTIMVHVDASDSAPERIAFAAQLAAQQDAHLVGIAQTGITRLFFRAAMPGLVDLSALSPLFEELREKCEARSRQFDALAQQAGITSFEHRIGDEDPANALATQAMYADLVIVGQADPQGRDQPDGPSVPEYVAMNSPCPVMVLPYAGAHAPSFGRILIGWNASPESARAVRMALPLLVQAREVKVALVERLSGYPGPAGSGNEIALFLSRHGVAVDLRQEVGDDAGESLLSLASEQGADLLVMGCYGHTRFREVLLGGASRVVLERTTVPVLLAH